MRRALFAAAAAAAAGTAAAESAGGGGRCEPGSPLAACGASLAAAGSAGFLEVRRPVRQGVRSALAAGFALTHGVE